VLILFGKHSESLEQAGYGVTAIHQAVGIKGRLHGCHAQQIDPENTTKMCSQCGMTTDELLWVKEHSCLSRGVTIDCDWNAALNASELGCERYDQDSPKYNAWWRLEPLCGNDHPLSVSAHSVVETEIHPRGQEATASAKRLWLPLSSPGEFTLQ